MNTLQIEISKYRFECAREDLKTSELSFENDMLKNSVNRSYYAIFHSVRAVNALEGFDSKKHSGVISFFNQNFVKTQIFDIQCSKWLEQAFRIRNTADYEDFYIVSKQDAKMQIKNAIAFLDMVEKYLLDKWQQ